MSCSVMITGVGAVIGQGIIRSLRMEDLDTRLISVDANPLSVGFKWSDAYYAVPKVTDPSWLPVFIDICKKENVDLILPGIEQDVKALMANRQEIINKTAAFPLLNSDEAFRVGFDKWELCLFARQQSLNVPQTWIAADVEVHSIPGPLYPLVLKPRKGMAGKGIYVVEKEDSLKCWLKLVRRDEYIIQQHIGNDDEEYTVSIFGHYDRSLSVPFILKRRLSYGSTFEAETVDSALLSDAVVRIAKQLKIVGPTNIQFRKSGENYYLLDINPRFSSSTSIKSAFGFNEPVMAVKSFLMRQPQVPLALKKGRCSRYIEDSITLS